MFRELEGGINLWPTGRIYPQLVRAKLRFIYHNYARILSVTDADALSAIAFPTTGRTGGCLVQGTNRRLLESNRWFRY